jgi:hypothetical protein
MSDGYQDMKLVRVVGERGSPQECAVFEVALRVGDKVRIGDKSTTVKEFRPVGYSYGCVLGAGHSGWHLAPGDTLAIYSGVVTREE